MKKIVLLFVFVLSGFAAQAQDIYWETNVEKAAQLSMKTNKPLLLFFTGSDWCGWCKRLQKEVLKTSEFAEWAQNNVILVELDFPHFPQPEALVQQNKALLQMFQVQGYPTVWFTNVSMKEGKLSLDRLGSTGWLAGGAPKWLETANQIIGKK